MIEEKLPPLEQEHKEFVTVTYGKTEVLVKYHDNSDLENNYPTFSMKLRGTRKFHQTLPYSSVELNMCEIYNLYFFLKEIINIFDPNFLIDETDKQLNKIQNERELKNI